MSSEAQAEVFFGQYGQDSVIDQFFRALGQEGGFFVDVGASDGVRLSNSFFLEKFRGWRGICVEAHPDYYRLLVENRPSAITYNVAAGDREDVWTDIRLNYRASLTTLDLSLDDRFQKDYKGYYASREEKKIRGFSNGLAKIKMRKIDCIIEENQAQIPRVDVLFIDIDGSELYAFRGLDLERWKPRILVLEHTVMGHDFLNRFAIKSGYRLSLTVGADNFYTREPGDHEILKNISPSKNLANVTHPVDAEPDAS